MSACSIDGCPFDSRARGMCTSHYYHLWRKPQDKDRVVTLRTPHHVKFTPEMWWTWWADREPDEQTLALRAGIDQVRASFSR